MYKEIIFALLSVFIWIQSSDSQTLYELNAESFDNFSENYNYTYWKENWMTGGAPRNFVNHTNRFALDVDYTNLNVNSLLVGTFPNGRKNGFHALHDVLFPANYQGNLGYAILQNGSMLYEKSSSPTSTGYLDSQMAEFGVWRNTRFVSANHTGGAPVDPYFTGIEFSTWHDRLKMTYHVKPTSDISNGQLSFTFQVPAAYTEYSNSGMIHAFGLPSDQGFAIKAGETVDSIEVIGNQFTIFSEQENMMMNESYEISLIFYAITIGWSASYSTIFGHEDSIVVSANQTAPYASTLTDITYDADQGVHYVSLPRINMGYFNCGLVDGQQRIDFELINPSSEERRVRLCLFREPNVNVTGFNSLICNGNGDPSGLPLQISKNWHTTTSQLFSGSWINEYTEIILPGNTTMNFQYKSTGAKWGETYSASSHQLSVAGVGIARGGWLEAALGTFGESITHSPDYEFGKTNGADVRPFLVTNQAYGGTSSQCGWTGNVGGIDMWVYYDGSNVRRYQSQVKTDFKKYSPNLTETSVSAISSDEKLKLDYTFHLNRSDDYNRIYYRVKIKALDNTAFNRFDIFQLGGDIYNIHNTQQVAYGNDTGRVAQFVPTNDGSNDYTTVAIALEGSDPWIWAGDGLNYTGATSGIDIDCNNGLIIRDYKGVFNGVPNDTPYFRERSSSQGFSSSHGTNPTSYCLVPPPGVTSFSTGDSIEFLAEVVILPKQAVDYYGTNQNFTNALTAFGNSFELLLREVKNNQIKAASPTHAFDSIYPLSVQTSNDEALLDLHGGVGYVPVVFTELTEVDDPNLWVAEDSCWQLVDQSVHGKDYWQAEYNENTGLFDLIYNVNQDRAGDSLAKTRYYLGDTPPVLELVTQSMISGQPVSDSSVVLVHPGVDSLTLSPQVSILGVVDSNAIGSWSWTGPSGFTSTGRELNFYPVILSDSGTYTVTYVAHGCSTSVSFHIVPQLPTDDLSLIGRVHDVVLYPNPAADQVAIEFSKIYEFAQIDLFDNLGRLLLKKEIESIQTTQLFFKQLSRGKYTIRIRTEQGTSMHHLIIQNE